MPEMMTVASERERENEIISLIPLAAKVYLFGYPLVIMEMTRQVMTGTSQSGGMNAPMGQFVHQRSLPDGSVTTAVYPSPDALHSSAWLDLREPIVLSVPDTAGRYYSITVVDAWTSVVSSIGPRTTGSGKGDFILVGPSFKGKLPPGPSKIASPTDLVWIKGRIQCDGKDDLDDVNALQDQLKLIPLRDWGHKSLESLHGFVARYEPHLPSRSIGTPPPVAEQVDRMDISSFYSLLCDLMLHDPPLPEDGCMVETMALFSMRPGEPLAPDSLEAIPFIALEEGAKKAHDVLELEERPPMRRVNGYHAPLNLGRYGTNYKLRALVARFHLGVNLPDDVAYSWTNIDSEGRQLVGENKYVLHFARDMLPPVNASWSVSLYNSKLAFVKNQIGRYSIGTRDDLRFEPDGSLDILIQRDSPRVEKGSNWLPAPPGGFSIMFRLYWPKEEALRGEWAPPAPARSG